MQSSATHCKHILCFGDSNTWGADPAGGPRFDRHTRWPGVMAEALGESFNVIEAGLCGRTTVWDDPVEGHKNGLTHLIPTLHSHAPLDVIIIMLGTNDLKDRFAVGPADIAIAVGRLVQAVRQSEQPFTGPPPLALVVCPPPTAPLTDLPFGSIFRDAHEKSLQLAEHFQQMADQLHVPWFDAGQCVRSSEVDGIHLDPAAHTTLGQALANHVRELIEQGPSNS